ncbi:hypothetical protein MMC11_000145 [Xylographa trunciseda]|nr:hypothetical protein [Xylographa trunciseda]
MGGDQEEAEEFWLFGYGLVSYAMNDIDVELDMETATPLWYESSHHMKIFQDHRGTPDAPGRVVTLIDKSFWETLVDSHASNTDRVWGAAYRIEASKVVEVQEYLDIREINGYSIQYTPFWPSDRDLPSIKCLVYIGLPDNPQFMGPQAPQSLAEHICQSRGPSGENVQYLFMLEHALKGLGKNSGDEHVHDLADRVRMIQASTPKNKSKITENAVEAEAEKVGNGQDSGHQEEVED